MKGPEELSGRGAATGGHAFDRLCDGPDIEYLTPPGSPRTDPRHGRHRSEGRASRPGASTGGARRRCKAITSDQAKAGNDAASPHVRPRNRQIPQSAPGSKPPLQAMRDRHKLQTALFGKQPYCLRGYDSCPQRPVPQGLLLRHNARGNRHLLTLKLGES